MSCSNRDPRQRSQEARQDESKLAESPLQKGNVCPQGGVFGDRGMQLSAEIGRQSAKQHHDEGRHRILPGEMKGWLLSRMAKWVREKAPERAQDPGKATRRPSTAANLHQLPHAHGDT